MSSAARVAGKIRATLAMSPADMLCDTLLRGPGEIVDSAQLGQSGRPRVLLCRPIADSDDPRD